MSDFTEISLKDNSSFIIPAEYAGERLDKVLVKLFPDYSRSRLQIWLKQGYFSLDSELCTPKVRVQGNELLEWEIPEQTDVEKNILPEDIPLDIVYQDEQIIVVNKPVGLVVHPGAGNWQGTLQNALLHYDANLAALPRAGIVHRLDKDTSGLLVIARTLKAHKSLVEQLQNRIVGREYNAIIQGVLVAGGTIDAAIARHQVDRKRMSVRQGGKEAITHYRVVERFRQHTHIRVKLETGRTHQIRVHMAHLKKPLIGDPVYGGRLKIPSNCSDQLRTVLQSFKRQALHAARLSLAHPSSGETMTWQVAIPEDMQMLIDTLVLDSNENAN